MRGSRGSTGTDTGTPAGLHSSVPLGLSMSKPRDFSSQSCSPASSGTPKKGRPTPAKDSGKSREKDDMVGLNDKFVMLIEKVKNLEDKNKKLDTKLKILKDQEDYDGKIEDIVRHLEDELEQQIGKLLRDQEKLKDELRQNQKEVDDTRKRYEDELQKKAEAENDFIVTKKDADEEHLEAVNLALELEDLLGKLDFLRAGFDEEIKELESHIQNETVIIRDNTKRSLDMDEVIESVRNQYATMAARTREEAETWNQRKMDVMVLKAGQREQEVRDVRREISDLLRIIQRLNGELEVLRQKEESLKTDISQVITEGDANLDGARADMAQLEEALRRAKQDLAGQIREHQELMNLKLALDIEIATYRKLLEGEEQRMNELMRNSDVPLPSKQTPTERPRAPEPSVAPAAAATPKAIKAKVIKPKVIQPYPSTAKRLLIKVEVEAGRVVSESSHYADD